MFEFKDFSDELKLRIFNFLDAKELSRIAKISKEWEALTKDKALWKKEKIADEKIEFCDVTFEEKEDASYIKSRTLRFTGTSVKEQLDDAIKNYDEGNIFIDLFSEDELKKVSETDITIKYNLLLNELKKIIPKEKLNFTNHDEKDESKGSVRHKMELNEGSTKILLEYYSPSRGIRRMSI